MLRRLNVINVATDGEHLAELATYPDLFQQPSVEQSVNVPRQPNVNLAEVAPAGGVAIDLAARREQQVVTAEEQRLADIREQVERFAA
jgi:hypothetical protein